MGIEYATCGDCGVELPDDREHCPHCGRPSRFPNVEAARRPDELRVLQDRYDTALSAARANGSEARLRDFQVGCEQARPVLCCPADKLLAIANKTVDQFANFYNLLDLKFASQSVKRKPDWNVIRPNSETVLLGSVRNIDKLHYAALSWTGEGLAHYGGNAEYCEVELREEMISHRTSLFEENLGVHYWRRRPHKFKPGKRAGWADRGKLCVAKLGSRITKTTSDGEFPAILLKSSVNPLDDEFVEVHVYGEMTFHTFRRVRVVTAKKSTPAPSAPGRPRKKRSITRHKVLEDRCAQAITNGQPVEYVES